MGTDVYPRLLIGIALTSEELWTCTPPTWVCPNDHDRPAVCYDPFCSKCGGRFTRRPKVVPTEAHAAFLADTTKPVATAIWPVANHVQAPGGYPPDDVSGFPSYVLGKTLARGGSSRLAVAAEAPVFVSVSGLMACHGDGILRAARHFDKTDPALLGLFPFVIWES